MKRIDFDWKNIREGFDCEFKRALGADGKGKVPDSMWETYSSFANTEGGYIFLGAEETHGGRVKWAGIPNVETVYDNVWQTLINPQKVSVNLLKNEDLFIQEISGVQVVVIHVPRASRSERPVYLKNQFALSYYRYHEKDSRCSEEQIQQMFLEKNSVSLDSGICENFSLEDLNSDTFRAYRQVFATLHPDSPFNTCSPLEFLKKIGGYRRDRSSGKEGLTSAGLLMFGKLSAILERFSDFSLDYQEQNPAVNARWVDRVKTSILTVENLYDFYRAVIQKLTYNLKVPFLLEGDTRKDEVSAHTALREAFVNCLIHANYLGKRAITIIRQPNRYHFQNPGLLLVSRDEIYQGGGIGVSVCRNRNLQNMFYLIGLAEQAGSGFPKIFQTCRQMSWKMPLIIEHMDTNQTEVILQMESLLPTEVVSQLQKRFGSDFNTLTPLGRIAVVTAFTEGAVSHSRLAELCSEYPADITSELQTLVSQNFLLKGGAGRGSFYYIPGSPPFGFSFYSMTLDDMAYMSLEDWDNLELTDEDSSHLDGNSSHLDGNSSHLKTIAEAVSTHGKVSSEVLRDTILKLCTLCPLSASELAELLKRKMESLRERHINPLCNEGKLERIHPNIINHPKQKYRTVLEENVSSEKNEH